MPTASSMHRRSWRSMGSSGKRSGLVRQRRPTRARPESVESVPCAGAPAADRADRRRKVTDTRGRPHGIRSRPRLRSEANVAAGTPARAPAPRATAVGDQRGSSLPRGVGRAGCERVEAVGGARRRCADRRPQRPPAADRRSPSPPLHARPRLCTGTGARRGHGHGRSEGVEPDVHRRLLLRGARRLAARRRDRGGPRGRARHQRRRRLLAARYAAHRPPLARARRHGRARHRLPRDRRARAAGAAARHARRACPRAGALGGVRLAPPRRVGDRPLVADRGLAGGAAARLQRRHPRLPLGGEGDGPCA